MGTHCLIVLRWSKALFKNRQKVWAFICVYQDVMYNDPGFSLPKDVPYSFTEQFHPPSEGWSLNHLTLRISGAYIYESARTVVKKEVVLKQVEKHLHGWAAHQGWLPREQVAMPVSQFILEGVWLHLSQLLPESAAPNQPASCTDITPPLWDTGESWQMLNHWEEQLGWSQRFERWPSI